MIGQKFLDYLRCPMRPSKTRLLVEDDALVCERCALRFAVKDRVPNFVVEEAKLPPGCESLADLPCQREGKHPNI